MYTVDVFVNFIIIKYNIKINFSTFQTFLKIVTCSHIFLKLDTLYTYTKMGVFKLLPNCAEDHVNIKFDNCVFLTQKCIFVAALGSLHLLMFNMHIMVQGIVMHR